MATGMQPLSERPAPTEVEVPKFIKFRQQMEQREKASFSPFFSNEGNGLQNFVPLRIKILREALWIFEELNPPPPPLSSTVNGT